MKKPNTLLQTDQEQIADTYNWDTVFATTFNIINPAIAASWPTMSDAIKKFNQVADDDQSYNVNGEFAPWQLTLGGDGKNIDISCTVKSGTYNTAKKSFQLDGLICTIEVNMDWVPDSSQKAFTIQGNDTVNGIIADLNNSVSDTALIQQFANNKVPLTTGSSVTIIKSGVEWIVTNGTNSYYLFYATDKANEGFIYVYQYGDRWKVNLETIGQDIGANDPAVVLKQLTNIPVGIGEIENAVLTELLTSWFETNVTNFNYIFNVLNLSTQIDKTDVYNWIKPTDTLYAVIDEGAMERSVFGVLTMVQNNPSQSNHQVSPNAIPAGCDAGFLISGTQFVKNVLMPAACMMFEGSSPSDFSITNDNLSIQNNNELTWGFFALSDSPSHVYTDNIEDAKKELDNGIIDSTINFQNDTDGSSYFSANATVSGKTDKWIIKDGNKTWTLEYNVTAKLINMYDGAEVKIPAEQFKMTLVNGQLMIEFINLYYPASDIYTVNMNYTEYLTLGLTLKDGKQIFTFTAPTAPSLDVAVTESKEAITNEIVSSVVLSVLGLVISVAGPAFEALASSAAATAEIVDDAANLTITADQFAAFEAANPDAIAYSEADAAAGAADTSGEQAANGGRWSTFKAAFRQPKYKALAAFGGVFGAVGGSYPSLYNSYLMAQANNTWQNVVGFEEFANKLIEPYSWPGVTAFNLQSAQLAGSLQIGLTVKRT